MPANYAPCVLITDIHTEVGDYLGYEFMSAGWFVVGADATGHTSHFTRAHIQVDVTDLPALTTALRMVAKRGNGLDCLVACHDVPLFGPDGEAYAHAVIERLAPMAGSLISVLDVPPADALPLGEIASITERYAAINPEVRVNTIAPRIGRGARAADEIAQLAVQLATSERTAQTLTADAWVTA